jgi:hypothetical protein
MVALKRSISARSPKRIVTSVSSATILPVGRPASSDQLHLAELSRRAARWARRACQPRHAAHAARAPRLHALADPDLLLRQQLVGAGIGQRLVLQLARLGGLVGGEVARVAAQQAAVELDDARGHGVDEGAVVRDEDQRALPAGEQVLQPLDGVDVEVVGGLVEQQHVGRGHQRARQRHALLHAARQRRHRRRAQVQPLQRLSTRCSQVQPPSASRRVCSASRSSPGGVRLVARAQRPRLGHALATASNTVAPAANCGSCAT